MYSRYSALYVNLYQERYC